MDWFTDPDVWIGLLTLTVLEIVLGIDNLIFISILSGKLPQEQQARARKLGLSLALITRILLLSSLAWVMKLDKPFWEASLFGHAVSVSGKDLILLLGGTFLVFKSTREIHEKIEGGKEEHRSRKVPSFGAAIVQILLLDLVFSLDSVITAVGMANQLGVMIAAVVLAMIVMLVFVEHISRFVERHPSIKMLALSFLILIGTMLVAEGCHQHVPKGYIYFAMAYAAVVEMLNIKTRSKSKKR
ncbi:MAG TPA: TerC family protein [Candidatus Limnocylindria bacterium]|jgi:predicted tellurium resistance membrane protein TerC|nr:TerC family protein [Candidatus Limnocylindria bacterium]